MKLTDLLIGLDEYVVYGDQNLDIDIDNVAYDSRKVRKGSIFVCIEGFIEDGHQYIQQVIDSGVIAVIVQKDVPQFYHIEIPFIKTSNTRKALARISANYFENPADHLYTVGITGTKGKTTTAFMIHAILEATGIKSALIGTILNKIGDKIVYASRTTPESYDLQALLYQCVSENVGHCVIEVSSQGLWLDRVYGFDFDIGVYTNLYNDHIGPREHANLEEYRDAKSILFERTEKGVINADADYADYMTDKLLSNPNATLYTYSITKEATVRALNLNPISSENTVGTEFDLQSPWYKGKVFVGMPGKYNVYNALAAITCAGIMGISFEHVLSGLSSITVKGRVQPIKTNRPFQVIVDHAHNAASLENLLGTLREYTKGRLISVFGCGGDRAKSRRFGMGEVSGKLSDFTYITSDNPRTESPEAILADVETGVQRSNGNYLKILDRTEAIKTAILDAREGDMIVIAGKGHETYQIFADKTIHYDDVEVVEEIIRELPDEV